MQTEVDYSPGREVTQGAVLNFLAKIKPAYGWMALSLYLLEGSLWNPHAVNSTGLLYWGQDFFWFMGIPLLMLWAVAGFNVSWLGETVRKLDKKSLRDIGRWVAGVLFCCAAIWLMAMVFSLFGGTLLSRLLQIPASPNSYHEIVGRQAPELRFLAGLYLSFSAGLVEEIYFRGLADRLARACKSPDLDALVYYGIGIGVFAAIHWRSGPQSTAGAIGIGWAASLLYRKSGSLSMLIAAHFSSMLG